MVDIALSLGNMRRLEADIKRLQRTLKSSNFEQDLLDDMGIELKEVVTDNVSSVSDVDGNYEGTEPPKVYYTSVLGDRVMWLGRQIAYVEFGTGATGAGRYPNPAVMASNGYSPDPAKTQWYYKDAQLGTTLSKGLAPQAPMYKSSLQMRMLLKSQRSQAHLRVRKLVANALTVK